MHNYRVEPEAPVSSSSKRRQSYSPEDTRKKAAHSLASTAEFTDPDPDPDPTPDSTTVTTVSTKKNIFETASANKIHQFASDSRTWIRYLMLTTDPHPSPQIKTDNARTEFLKAKDDHIQRGKITKECEPEMSGHP
jgi:hypothetical protein